ncbi:hypothetical protein EDB80DRAFT_693685 [Ilyonectria destructans]|nr:hypothetical protein EDB80DRAFT_693685 [Ilyonectria destructans]
MLRESSWTLSSPSSSLTLNFRIHYEPVEDTSDTSVRDIARYDDDNGELVDDTSFGMNRLKSAETGWIFALVDVNGSILPGFANETVSRLGMGPFHGLHVRINISLGRYVEPDLNLRFFVRHASDMVKFHELSLSLRRIVDRVQLDDVDTHDQNALAALYKHHELSMDGLHSSSTVPDFFADSLVTSEAEENNNGHPADLIQKIASTVQRLRFDFDWVDILSIPSTAGMEPEQPEDLRTVVDAVKGALELQNLTTFTLWLFPDDSSHDVWWDALSNLFSYTQPCTDLLRNVRDNSDDLAFGSIRPEDIVC